MSNENKNEYSLQVGPSSFDWKLDEGEFKFMGGDAVLFWIDTAMKSFFDSIEEVSGDESASLVFEAAGFRMGKIVSDFFGDGSSVHKVLSILEKVYPAAGWGYIETDKFDPTDNTAIIRLKNSWEYKINKQQNRKTPTTFLAAHYAGVISGLLDEKIWFKMNKSQLLGDEYDEIMYFPSTITPAENIHTLIREKEQNEIFKLEQLVEQRTKELQEMVRELSSPMIPVLDHIAVIPMLGKYDETRAEDLLDRTLTNLPKVKPKYIILDLTGLDEAINYTFGSLVNKLSLAVSLMGTETILVGISPELSMEMIRSQTEEVNDLQCFSTLKHAILYALSQEGKQLI
ncbi:STAS domain-containing protein [Bacillus marinisedimentorum]|uniref:STAS domain-containing protein n=1 Tax=Bacillus marinisedimentorum TaxID=1821260 RepID=UPI0007E244C6|nr:STAS domain-containing protein [Bacillus marinisedimentorum]